MSKEEKTPEGDYVIATPEVKGTLNLSSYAPDTLNPLATGYSCVRDFLYLAYEGLFVVNEDLSVTGVLATSYKVSGKKIKINLKKDVKFHDGSTFTSEDVIATFDYIRLHSEFYKDALKGMVTCEASGDYSILITLDSPVSNFVCNLDFPILPSGITEAEFFSENFAINGTGRYMYKKTTPYVSLELTKNTKWHGKDNVYIPTVNIRFVDDNEGMLYAFDSGETDIITTDRARWGEFSYTGDYKTYEITTTKYMFIGINTKNGVFSDVKLRQSLFAAIDRKTIVDTVMFSHAVVTDTPLSPKAYFFRSDKSDKKDYDVKALTDAKIDKLFILYNEEDKTKEAIAEYLCTELTELGINAELSAVDYATYITKINSGDYQLYIGKVDVKRDSNLGFMFANPSEEPPAEEETEEGVEQQIEQETVSVEVEEGNSEEEKKLPTVVNICDFSDIKLTDIIDNLNGAKDTDAMKLSYNNLKQFYETNYPQIPLFHMNDAVFVNSRIKGVLKPNLTSFYADMGGIYIE